MQWQEAGASAIAVTLALLHGLLIASLNAWDCGYALELKSWLGYDCELVWHFYDLLNLTRPQCGSTARIRLICLPHCRVSVIFMQLPLNLVFALNLIGPETLSWNPNSCQHAHSR
ncbi:hypothetical protein BDW60DRAFT_67700 [Aspergillus nidulans var. acristatus]